jgi:hypothetical protein
MVKFVAGHVVVVVFAGERPLAQPTLLHGRSEALNPLECLADY